MSSLYTQMMDAVASGEQVDKIVLSQARSVGKQLDPKVLEALRLIYTARNGTGLPWDDVDRALARAELHERSAEFILHILGLVDTVRKPALETAP